MAVSTLVDLVKIQALSIGAGSITLGSPVPGFRGVEVLTNGATYSYSIQQNGNYEAGQGIYLTVGNVFTRAPAISSNGNAAIDLAAGAVVSFTALASDFGGGGGTDGISAEELALNSGATLVGTETGETLAVRLAQLAQIGVDGFLAPAEKLTVVLDFTNVSNEKAGIDAQADARGVSRVAYDAAYDTLSTYLLALSPAYNDMSQSTVITRSTYNSHWADLYSARQDLLNALTNGLNTARILIYKRAASAPALPSASTTYTFATAVLAGLNNGWSTTIPTTDGNPLYVSAASAVASGATDTIAAGEWAAASILAETGGTGPAGTNTATVFLYQRATSAPAVPAGSTTYTFATGVLTGTLGGWTQSVPSGTNPIYVTTATALGTGLTDTIATGEWATPNVLAQNGAPGADGAAGLNNARILVYQRAASAPSLPSATTTYTFATGVLTGLNNGWTQAIPTANGNPLYVTAASASAAGTTDTIASGEWAAAVIMAQDGSAGGAGINSATVFLYQRATSAPAVPAGTTTYTFATGVLSGTLGGWTQSVPSGTNPIYVTTATALGTGPTDTIATGEWATPNVLAQNGTNGSDGTSPVLAVATPSLFGVRTDASGNIISGIPQSINFTAVQGTSAATITAVAVSGTPVNCTASVTSLVGSIDTIVGSSGSAVFSVTANGITVLVTVNWTATANGTNGATQNQGFSNTNITSTSYTTTVSGTLLNVPASGNISFAAIINYAFAGGTARTLTGEGKIQWRVVGGTFADVSGSETIGTQAVYNGLGGPNNPGAIDTGTHTVTGLTPGQQIEGQVLVKKQAGTASVTNTTDSTLTMTQA